MKNAEETWVTIPSKKSHMASSLGRVKAKSRLDAAGKTRAERVLTVMYKSSLKFPEKTKHGFVRVVDAGTISYPYVRDLVAEAFYPHYDRQWHMVAYRDNNAKNCSPSNLDLRSKLAVKLEEKLRPLLYAAGAGSEANA